MKKLTLIFFLFLFTALNLQAQIIYRSWVTRFDPSYNGYDEASQVVIDNSGNAYVTGFSFSPTTNYDYLTIKYKSSNGVQEWNPPARYIGINNYAADRARSITVDNMGNVYVTGISPRPCPSNTCRDIATIKYNSSGVQQWNPAPRYSDDNNRWNEANSIALDNNANVYVTGLTSPYLPAAGNFITIKYNASGVQQWVRSPDFGTQLGHAAYKIVVDGDGNSYVTGQSIEPGGNGSPDYLTIKYNTGGDQQWMARYDGTAHLDDIAHSIGIDGDGNVYVTGEAKEDEGAGPLVSITTVKYNSSGVQQWVSKYYPPSNVSAVGTSLALYLPTGTNPNAPDVPYLYVAGYSSGSGTHEDYTLIQYDLSGTQQWVARYDGTGNDEDRANSIAVDAFANAYVTGYTTNNASQPNKDYTTLKYNPGGALKWVGIYDGDGNGHDEAQSIVTGYPADFYITGWSWGGPSNYNDYATIKYSTSWIVLSIGITDDLHAISLFGKDTAFAVGSNGKIIFTSNSGLNWTSQSSGTTNVLNSVYFINSHTGFVVGDSGTILRSTDAGNSWSSQSDETIPNLNSVHFITTDIGTIVGSAGTILQTTDAGSTWLARTSGTGKNLNSVFFTVSSSGIAVGNSGTILKTTDGGLSWLSQSIGSNNLNSIRFANSNKGIAVGDNGTVLHTTNGGIQWKSSPYDSTSKLRNVYCLDTSVYYAVGDAGLIISTTNSGGEWNVQPSGVTHNLGGVVIADLNTGISVGDNGTILLTTLGYVTGDGSNQNHPVIIGSRSGVPQKFALYQNYPNPFNPTTEIKYYIPLNAKVQIKIYNVIGEEVAQLVNEFKFAGIYTVTFDGTNLASGVYFYKLIAGNFTDAKKMVLVK